MSNKYVGRPYCSAEMYAGRVAYCPLVSHGEYAGGTYIWRPPVRLLICLTDKQTNGRTPDN